MNLALTVLEITAPVFALAAIGFTWVRLGYEYPTEFVTRLAMTLGVPALIFVALMQTDIALDALSRIALAAAAAYVLVTGVTYLVARLAGFDLRTYLAPLSMGNTGNIGLPLAVFAYGDTGLGFAVVVFAVSVIYAFTFGVWMVAGASSLRPMLREPMIWATVLGALFLWQGWETPTVVTNTLSLLGQLAIPLMLITLGTAVARLTPANVGTATLTALAKAAICVTAGWTIASLFALPPVAFGILVLQIAAPAAVTSYLIAVKYKADAQAVAGLVVMSTLLAVVILPLILAAVL